MGITNFKSVLLRDRRGRGELPETLAIKLRDAEVKDGDIFLFRKRGLISAVGRGRHTHAAMACWCGMSLMMLEVRQFTGGRAIFAAREVERLPGRIDWYKAGSNYPPAILSQFYFSRSGAVAAMIKVCGCRYGWFSLARAALYHLPVVRLFVRPVFDDASGNGHPPYCSQAVASATRIGGGFDPVPGLGDRVTEPADLARSLFYQYQGTLEL